MRFRRRIFVWIIEIALEATCVACTFLILPHSDIRVTAKDMLGLFLGTVSFMGLSGYLLTSLTSRILLAKRWFRAYPFV